MDNHDIQRFFEDSGLAHAVEHLDRPPNVVWRFRAAGFPVFIQTQENVNRMRIVAFVADADDLDADELTRLLEANYHSALDARYALTDGRLVAAFIHPLRELTLTQFLLGLYQAVHCAHSWGDSYSGGTLVFGVSTTGVGRGDGGATEEGIEEVMEAVVGWIKPG